MARRKRVMRSAVNAAMSVRVYDEQASMRYGGVMRGAYGSMGGGYGRREYCPSTLMPAGSY